MLTCLPASPPARRQIGTPPRPFRLNLDTGSSSLSVPAVYSSCTTCDPHFDRGYDEAKSSTAEVLLCSDAQCGDCPSACGSTDSETYSEVNTFLDGQNECRAQPHLAAGCTVCHDTCPYAGDGVCDDGSKGGEPYCEVGTDSRDCVRSCRHTAAFAHPFVHTNHLSSFESR